MNKRGLLVLYTGASGVGKGTIMKSMLEKNDNIFLSVSCTTRSPRPGEKEGVDYHYISEKEFTDMIDNDGFLEYAKYCQHYYGTPKPPIEENLEKGKDVFLEIEVQGGIQVMKKYPDCVSIFVLPPSMEELENRLRSRGTEEESVILERLETAKKEITFAEKYKYNVVNDTVENACKSITDILEKERKSKV